MHEHVSDGWACIDACVTPGSSSKRSASYTVREGQRLLRKGGGLRRRRKRASLCASLLESSKAGLGCKERMFDPEKSLDLMPGFFDSGAVSGRCGMDGILTFERRDDLFPRH
jgi:hypothetical protein